MSTFTPPDRHDADGFALRCYHAGDGPRLAEACNASYEHLRTFMAWAEPHVEVEECERRALWFEQRWRDREDFVVGIFTNDGTQQLGGSGFHLREGAIETRNAEIGMWVRADRAHGGLGTHILVEMLEWGFESWGWERLTWRCNERNVASHRVAEKAGMVREGVLRGHRLERDGSRGDTICFAALRGEWTRPSHA